MSFQRPFLLSLRRQDNRVPWGFRLTGGSHFNQPLTVQKVAPDCLGERSGLREGDELIQIGRVNVQDMTQEEVQGIIANSGNRLELFVIREDLLRNRKENEPTTVKAVVHAQYNSPLNLYSTENIADTLATQARILTDAGFNDYSGPTSPPVVLHSQVLAVVKEAESKDYIPYSAPLSLSKKPPPPPPPPKPQRSGPLSPKQKSQKSPGRKPKLQQQSFNQHSNESQIIQNSHYPAPVSPAITQQQPSYYQKPVSPVSTPKQPSYYQSPLSPTEQKQTIPSSYQKPASPVSTPKQPSYYQSPLSPTEQKQTISSSYQKPASPVSTPKQPSYYQSPHSPTQKQSIPSSPKTTHPKTFPSEVNHYGIKTAQPQYESYQPLTQQTYQQQHYQDQRYQTYQQQEQNQQRIYQSQHTFQPQKPQQRPQVEQPQQRRQQETYQTTQKVYQTQHQQQQSSQRPFQQQSTINQRQEQRQQTTRDAPQSATQVYQAQNAYQKEVQKHHQPYYGAQARMNSFSPPSSDKRPVWPPKYSSVKELPKTGFSPQLVREEGSKKFIWPPPKDAVNGRYDSAPGTPTGQILNAWHPNEYQPRNTAYASPTPSRKAKDVVWPPSHMQVEGKYKPVPRMVYRSSGRVEDYVRSNAGCGVPGTYRAPPGTQHVEVIYE